MVPIMSSNSEFIITMAGTKYRSYNKQIKWIIRKNNILVQNKSRSLV